MSNQPTEGSALRAALASELERRRGHAPEPGEIFVLTETAELPVEWALLEARPLAFLAVPADVQPLAGSRDLALGPDVLSGPLVLRCGHAVPIAAARLRPELRTGLLDPATLTAARALHAILAAGTSDPDPLGEEIDRDPEYRDWVEEVLDPARAVLAGLAGLVGEGREEKEHLWGGEVVEMGDWRARQREKAERSGGTGFREWVRRGSPWLAAALLAVAFGLSWQVGKLRSQLAQPLFDELNVPIELSTSRGEEVVSLPSDATWIRFAVFVPDIAEGGSLVLALTRKGGELVAQGPPREASPGDERSISVRRGELPTGLYRIQLRRASDTQVVAERILRLETEEPARAR